MKRSRIVFVIIPMIGFLLYSCTKLDSPYAIANDTKHRIIDTIMDWDTVNAVRKVLLEDYTGHLCVNCPEAAVIAHSLEELYAGKLIVMAVHAGLWAKPGTTGDFTADYTSPASEVWNTELGINSSDPSGMVNRKDFGSGKVLGKEVWSSSISQVIGLSPDAFIVINNSYVQSSRLLNYAVYTKFINQLSGTYKLTLCIVEDSLHSAQKNNNPAIGTTPIIYNYNFMGVLRGAINGSWGEVLTTSINTGHTYLDKFSYTLKSTWNPKNCWLYAFVYKEDTKEIVQVDRKKVAN